MLQVLKMAEHSGDLRQDSFNNFVINLLEEFPIYISKRNITLFWGLIISAISDRRMTLTKSISLQFLDFRTVFSVFRLIYTYYSLNSIPKRQEKF